jgi:hypothetical protein
LSRSIITVPLLPTPCRSAGKTFQTHSNRPCKTLRFSGVSPYRTIAGTSQPGCFLATTERPSDSSPTSTVKRFDDPEFVVFFYEMPHLVKLNFLNVLRNLRFRRVQTGFFDPSVNQRAVASEHLAEHTVRRFGKRIKDNANGFCADNFVVSAVVTDDKMPSTVLAFIVLFAACKTALVKMLRMTVLAIHWLDNLSEWACYLYVNTLKHLTQCKNAFFIAC